MLSTDFKKAATDIVNTFAVGENGEACIYKELLTSTAYDPVTGTVTKAYTEHTVNVALSGITNKLDFPEHFLNEHLLVFISGENISFIPKEGDILIWDNKNLLLDNSLVIKDMYGAAYALYMKEVA